MIALARSGLILLMTVLAAMFQQSTTGRTSLDASG